MNKKKLLINIFYLSGWIILIIFILFNLKSVSFNKKDSYENQVKKYPLLSKRILLDNPNDILINFLELRKELRAQVAPFGDSFGFYFEYLPTGTSIGVNEKNEFYAASLFKVPVIMAYYKYLERMNSEDELEKEITIENEDIDSRFGDIWKKGPGFKLKTREAIRIALEKSDNTTAKAIARKITEEDFDKVYEGLDIELETASGGAILTAKNYSSILKALYFSSVLTKDHSNQILNYLTNSNFDDKIVSGLPADIKIAHKIGNYTDSKDGKAYMDCGIVYLPKRPYLLCMLSIGDEKTAQVRMSKLSNTIYNYVSKSAVNN